MKQLFLGLMRRKRASLPRRVGMQGRIARLDWLEQRIALTASTAAQLTPPQVAYTDFVEASVVGRYVFYNNSKFDGFNPAASAADDAAIAPDKAALLPGQTASFANYTSFSRGINGVMVDILGLPNNPTASDFSFLLGNSNTPGTWTAAPAPASISVRNGAGVNGSDRVTITWADGAIQQGWLQVTVLADANTGLAQNDVFYFGSSIGESGDSTQDAFVNATDELLARHNARTFTNPAPITFPYDYNRDGFVDATDQLLARHNSTNFLNALKLITPAATVQPQFSRVQPNFINWADGNTNGIYYGATLVKTNAGTLVEISDIRQGAQDNSSYGFAMRRSFDHGATWSPVSVIYSDPSARSNGGSPVVDQQTGNIYFIFTKSVSQVFVMQSANDGATWSAPTDITANVKVTSTNNPAAPGLYSNTAWGWYAVGPGHGIQLQQGNFAGRLMVAADHRFTADGSGPSFSHTIYSDDHGATWHLGGGVSTNNFSNWNTNEASLVELSNGNLYMSMRSVAANVKNRYYSISTDGGSTWSTATKDPALVVPSVEGSVLRLNSNTILFASPSSQYQSRDRMTIWASFDDGKTWPVQKTVFWDYAGYGDMVVSGNNTVLMAFNRGFLSGPASFFEDVGLVRINLQSLLNSAPPQFSWYFNNGPVGSSPVVGAASIQDYSKYDLRATPIAPSGVAPVYIAGPNGNTALSIGAGGAANYVRLTPQDTQALSFLDSESYTIEMTFRTRSSDGTLIGGNPQLYGWSLQLVGGAVQFQITDSSSKSATITSTGTVSDGSWHQLVAVRNAQAHTLSLFIDGQSVGDSVADPTTTPQGAYRDPVTLGAFDDGTGQLALDVAAVRVTRAVLPQANWLPSNFVDPQPLLPPPDPANSPKNIAGLVLWSAPYNPFKDFSDMSWSEPLPISPAVGSAVHSGYDSSNSNFKLQTVTNQRNLTYAVDPVMGPVWFHGAKTHQEESGFVVLNSNGTQPNNFDFVQNTGVFTLSVFVKVNVDFVYSFSLFDTNEGASSASIPGFDLQRNTAGKLSMTITDGSDTPRLFDASSATLADSTWYHVAVVGNGPGQPVTYYITPVTASTVQSYTGGVIGGQNGTFATDANHDLRLEGTNKPVNDGALNGYTTQQMIFNRALSPAEIQQLFDYGKSAGSATAQSATIQSTTTVASN